MCKEVPDLVRTCTVCAPGVHYPLSDLLPAFISRAHCRPSRWLHSHCLCGLLGTVRPRAVQHSSLSGLESRMPCMPNVPLGELKVPYAASLAPTHACAPCAVTALRLCGNYAAGPHNPMSWRDIASHNQVPGKRCMRMVHLSSLGQCSRPPIASLGLAEILTPSPIMLHML